MEPVELPLGKVLQESGGKQSHVYFPTTAIISLLYAMEDGASADFAAVGNEGLVGIALFMGSSSTLRRALVGSAGLAAAACTCYASDCGAYQAAMAVEDR